jgi:Ino eighty subunit 2
MARRRKNLSEKRNEEEKMDTINRLLKKQAPKRRGKISQAEIAAGANAADTPDPTGSAAEERYEGPDPADPVFARWVSRKEGTLLGLPFEWKSVDGVPAWGGNDGWKEVRVVEEVEG